MAILADDGLSYIESYPYLISQYTSNLKVNEKGIILNVLYDQYSFDSSHGHNDYTCMNTGVLVTGIHNFNNYEKKVTDATKLGYTNTFKPREELNWKSTYFLDDMYRDSYKWKITDLSCYKGGVEDDQ
ncbi:MAG: hypothetical protein WBI17_03740 [Clostridiaceae bacterium]